MSKGMLFYDIEVFEHDSLVVFKNEDESFVKCLWNDDNDRPQKLHDIVTENIIVGYNNYHYDDYILTYMLQHKTDEDIKKLNDKIIRGDEISFRQDNRIESLDASQQIGVGTPSLKMIEGNLGLSIEESKVSFDIDRPLTAEEKKDTEFYCGYDVSATIRVYQMRKQSYFDVKDGLINMMEEPDKAKRWNTTTISSNILLGDKKSVQWSGTRYPDRFIRTIRNIPEEAWKMWEGLNITNIGDKGNFVETEAFGCKIRFGVGGLHGAPENPEVFENVLDADVASMYPSIIVHPEIKALGDATDIYDGIRKERVAIKKTDPIKAGALKIVLNSVYGNFKNRYSALYNPFASATVTIYGQIAAIELCNLLSDAGYRITNINTDGVMFLENQNATRTFEDIQSEWQEKFGMSLELEKFDKFIQRDVNNYIAISNGNIKAKGGDINHYASPLPFQNDNARIVQIALVDYLAKGVPVKDTFDKYINDPSVWQYVLRAGSTYRCVKDSNGNVMNKVNRVFAAKEDIPDTTILKKWKSDGTSSKFADAPERMYIWNDSLDKLDNLGDILDIDHYMNLVNKKIEAWTKAKDKPKKRAKKTDTEDKTEPEVKVIPVDPLETIAKRFRNAKKKRKGREWLAYCPIHEAEGKHNPSLSIWTDDGKKIHLTCRSQKCSEQDIMKAVGITYTDLGRGRNENPYKWKSDFAADMCKEYGTEVLVKAHYDYTTIDGKYVYSKMRCYVGDDPEKVMRVIRRSKDGSEYYTGKGNLNPDPAMYNVKSVIDAVRKGIPVYYVEGEKDVDTLKDINKPATTSGSASEWKRENAVLFTGAKVTIFADNDEVGKKSAEEIRKDISRFAFATRIYVPSDKPKGDITDYLTSEGDWETVEARLANMKNQYEYPHWINAEISKGEVEIKINSGMLATHIGSTRDFYIVKHPGDSKESYYEYDGHCYRHRSVNDLESMVQDYIPCAYRSDSMIRNVANLIRRDKRHQIDFDELDSDEDIIITKNGVIYLNDTDEEGRFILHPHTAKIKSTYCVKTEYDPEARCDVFMKYIKDLCTTGDGTVDKEKMASIQEYCGLIISNIQVMKTKKSLWLYSPQGNTGKSQLLKVITELIGTDKQCNINLTEMNRDRNKFSMMAIVGKRMIQMPDMSSAQIDNSTVFKQLVGGDRVTIEGKGKDVFDYQYRGGLIVASNGLPTFKDDKGDHIPERMLIIECEHHIAENERDTDIFDKMKDELPGILNWCLEGVVRYMENGYLTESESSKEARRSYKERSDTVFRFINHNYMITLNRKDRVKRSELDDKYAEWFAKVYPEEDQKFSVKKENIKGRLAGYGVHFERCARIGNAVTGAYIGIRELTDEEKRNIPDDEI